MATLVRLLDSHAEHAPQRLACVIGEEQRTYGELADETRRFAFALTSLGLQQGDRVSLYLPNSVEYVVAFYGTMRAGMIANPINSVLTPSEVTYLLDDCGAAALVATPDLMARLGDSLSHLPLRLLVTTGTQRDPGTVAFADLLNTRADALLDVDDGEPACLPYSSGTTGRPKGIVHTHDSLAMQAILSANHLQIRPNDVLLQALPLVHLYPGNIIMGGLIAAGATMVVQPTFDTSTFVKTLGTSHASACAGVPTTYAMLCQLPEQTLSTIDLSTLQIGFSAGAQLPSRIRSDFLRLYGVQILDCYGITEAAGNLAATMRYGEKPELSCGVPYPMTDVRIIDDHTDQEAPVGEVGELVARGPQIMAEYWKRPEDTAATLRGGWLHTGDLARRDELGYFYIVDRKKDMIISGGYNVYPAEVEEVVQAHTGVAMCGVFGVPDAIKGEKPYAAVVPRSGVAVDEAALDAYCRERLAPYKVPRKFVIVEELPRSSVGKILRRELRRVYAPATETESAGAPPLEGHGLGS